MRRFISCLAVLIVILIASIISGCYRNENVSIKEKDVDAKDALILEIAERIKRNIDGLLIPVKDLTIKKIEDVCSLHRLEKAKITGLGGVEVIADDEKQLCGKVRDFAQFQLNSGQRKYIQSNLEKMIKLIEGCGECSREATQLKEWHSFYTKCMVRGNCYKAADFTVEIINRKQKGQSWLDRIAKWWNNEKVTVRIETRDKDSRFKVLQKIDLSEKRLAKIGIRNVKVTEKQTLNAMILKTDDNSVRQLNFVDLDILPDFCSEPPVGKRTRRLIHRIDENETVELKIKMTSLNGEVCPWKV